jgi:hypothetical protein
MSDESWAPMRHRLRRHRKYVEAGPEAAWLMVCLILWADEERTDGYANRALILSVAGAGGVPERRVNRLIERLVSVRLLDEMVGGGWVIHDYHEYQRKAADIERMKQLARDRKRAQREKEARTGTNGYHDVTRDGRVTSRQDRSVTYA